jgi:hypothetical protein
LDPAAVAVVGDLTVSRNEFILSYQFNPFLSNIKQPAMAKQTVLQTLIAEKILVLEGLSRGYQNDSEYTEYCNQFRREALIEELWDKKIFPESDIPEEMLREVYRKDLNEKIIRYIIFDTPESARNFLNSVNDFHDFASAARLLGYTDSTIPGDTIRFGSRWQSLEDTVFNMAVGAVSKPIKVGDKYLVVKLSGQHFRAGSKDDFDRNKKRLLKILRRNQKTEALNQFIRESDKLIRYDIDRNTFKELVNRLADILFPVKIQNRNLSLDKIQLPEDLSSRQIIHFIDNQDWTVKTLLRRLAVSPYPVQTENLNEFQNSMIAATRAVLDDEMLARESERLGYESDPEVVTNQKMWCEFYVFRKMIENPQLNLEKPAEMQRFLENLKGKYDIRLNQSVVSEIKFDRADMIVMKTHFPLRSIVPVIAPIRLPFTLQDR